MFEWTFSLGNIATISVALLGYVGTFIGGFYALRYQTQMQAAALKWAMEAQTERLSTLGGRMINLETEVKELKQVLVTLAQQDQRLLALRSDQVEANARMNRMQEQINLLNNHRWNERHINTGERP